MACILWMPAAQGMPNCALAIGKSFSLWFIFLSSDCNRMGKKMAQEGSTASDRTGKWDSFEQPLAYNISAPSGQRGLILRETWIQTVSVAQLPFLQCQFLVWVWEGGTLLLSRETAEQLGGSGQKALGGKHIYKAWWRNKSSTCLFQVCLQLILSGDFASTSSRFIFSLKNILKSLSGF